MDVDALSVGSKKCNSDKCDSPSSSFFTAVDVWDGSSEPEVYHGHTFTSRILLRGILEVIAEAAFVTSDYPVILSIENHLSPPFQKQMAQMMREILRQYIYLDDVPEKQTQFPSPEVFKKRIFIKGKADR